MDTFDVTTERPPVRSGPNPVVILVLAIAGAVALAGAGGLVLLGLYFASDSQALPDEYPVVPSGGNAGPNEKAAPSKKVPVGKNVYLEIMEGGKRRVLVSTKVCLREGELEQFMCRKETKEHEAIVTADVDARDIHKALLAAGAEAGSPVKFGPPFEPASGTKIRVLVRYEKDKKVIEEPAQRWVRNAKTQKDLEYDWVFAGSQLIQDPLDKNRPAFYAANDGTLICVSNFDSAMLDLPVKSSKDFRELVFVAHTERIPPKETTVVVILEPIPEKK